MIDKQLGTGRRKVNTLPSESIDDEMRDYLSNARTIHKQIDAPGHQLE